EILLPLDDTGMQLITIDYLEELARVAGFVVAEGGFSESALAHIIGCADTNAKTIRNACERQTKVSLNDLQRRAAALGGSKRREVKCVLAPHAASGGQDVVFVFADDTI
ncbi:MAG: hypothetical protein J0653_06490, partial [Deltaproteobacteria bacterium]|nr:hypothetical protein [Deltaproteobacteria bacterium]